MSTNATKTIIGLCLAGLAGAATAEPGGLFVGRSGNPATLPDVSAELGYIKEEEGNTIGARINYRLDERTMLYGDFGRSRFEDSDSVPENRSNLGTAEASGNGFGAGVIYHMPDLVASYDVSLQASYHTAGLDGSGFIATSEVDGNGQFSAAEFEKLDATVLYAGLVLSDPTPLAANGLSWYATLGFAQRDTEASVSGQDTIKDDSSDPVFGGGLVLPLASGQAYAGYESFDGDASFGAGFRYFMR